MPSWKMPPIEKIHEAYGALADGRVRIEDGSAFVISSDETKKYAVIWEGDTYSSNDNASYWQGYMGYPLIAVLMMRGLVPYDEAIAAYFQGINWKERNTAHRNKYAKVVAKIMEELRAKGVDCNRINAEIQKVYAALKSLDIGYKRGKKPPR
jgi:hypothetical protein